MIANGHRKPTETQIEMQRHREILAAYERQAAGMDAKEWRREADQLGAARGILHALVMSAVLMVLAACLAWAVPL
jgi:hypothetical protein